MPERGVASLARGDHIVCRVVADNALHALQHVDLLGCEGTGIFGAVMVEALQLPWGDVTDVDIALMQLGGGTDGQDRGDKAENGWRLHIEVLSVCKFSSLEDRVAEISVPDRIDLVAVTDLSRDLYLAVRINSVLDSHTLFTNRRSERNHGTLRSEVAPCYPVTLFVRFCLNLRSA